VLDEMPRQRGCHPLRPATKQIHSRNRG
jgi:hypothetical protein